jgi:hypothetical protein
MKTRVHIIYTARASHESAFRRVGSIHSSPRISNTSCSLRGKYRLLSLRRVLWGGQKNRELEIRGEAQEASLHSGAVEFHAAAGFGIQLQYPFHGWADTPLDFGPQPEVTLEHLGAGPTFRFVSRVCIIRAHVDRHTIRLSRSNTPRVRRILDRGGGGCAAAAILRRAEG